MVENKPIIEKLAEFNKILDVLENIEVTIGCEDKHCSIVILMGIVNQ